MYIYIYTYIHILKKDRYIIILVIINYGLSKLCVVQSLKAHE